MAAGAGGGAVVGFGYTGQVTSLRFRCHAVGSITFSTAELLSGMLGCTANGISNFAGNAVGGGGGYKKPKSSLSGKEGAGKIFSEGPTAESIRPNRVKILRSDSSNGQYGAGNYEKGPTSEFNRIQKWGDRVVE